MLILISASKGQENGDGDIYHLIVLAGQSNMVGYGDKKEVKGYELPKNVKLFDYTSNGKKMWQPNAFGPELGMALELVNRYPEKKFLIVKYAIGGTPINAWLPKTEEGHITTKTNLGFENIYQNAIACIKNVKKRYNAKLIGVCWMQGERDAKLQTTAEKYEDNFKSFISSIRSEFNNAQLPFIFGEINPPIESYPAVVTVVKAQLEVEKETNDVWSVGTGDLTKLKDGVHYDSFGQLTLGKRFGSTLIRTIDGAFY